MKPQLARTDGYITPEEVNATLGGLMDKLVNSPAINRPSIISPLVNSLLMLPESTEGR